VPTTTAVVDTTVVGCSRLTPGARRYQTLGLYTDPCCGMILSVPGRVQHPRTLTPPTPHPPYTKALALHQYVPGAASVSALSPGADSKPWRCIEGRRPSPPSSTSGLTLSRPGAGLGGGIRVRPGHVTAARPRDRGPAT
jgi:hypothetical protein